MNSTVEQLLDRMKYDTITLIQTRRLTILLSERIAIRMIWLRVYYFKPQPPRADNSFVPRLVAPNSDGL